MNQLLPIVSGGDCEDTVHIHQDVMIFLSYLESGKTLVYRQKKNHCWMYLYVIKGSLLLNNAVSLIEKSSVKITELSKLEIQTQEEAHFILIELPPS